MKTVLHYIRPKAGIIAFEMLIKFSGTAVELLLPWMLIRHPRCGTRAAGDTCEGFWRWGGLMALVRSAGLAAFNVVGKPDGACTHLPGHHPPAPARSLRKGHAPFLRDSRTLLPTPSLISRLTSDTYNVHQMIDRMQRLGVRAPILLLGGVAVTLSAGTGARRWCSLPRCPFSAPCVWLVSRKGIRTVYPHPAGSAGWYDPPRAGEHDRHPRHPGAFQNRITKRSAL